METDKVIQRRTKQPTASSTSIARRMSQQRSRDTGPERAIRSILHGAGLRYRIHRRPLPDRRREADIVFPTEKVAVFVDGCFWHACPNHASWPKSNAAWWRDKIERNQARDQETDEILRDNGWFPIRVWEHEDPESAASKIIEAVQGRR